MATTRNNAYYTALRNEIETDPQALGYATYRANGADNMLTYLLDYMRDGTQEPITGVTKTLTVTDGQISLYEFYTALGRNDVNALTGNDIVILQIYMEAVARLGYLDMSNNQVNNAISNMFAGKNTLTRLTNRATRSGSRAEQLWGAGWTVTDEDIAVARGAGW